MFRISQIKIRKLFGVSTYKIRVKKNTLILVAENGSGKTTIVNIIYYFLSKQWEKLIKYDFESIEVIINNEIISLAKSEIDIFSSPKIQRLLKKYPQRIRDQIKDISKKVDFADLSLSRHRLENYAHAYGLPSSIVYELISIVEREQLNLFETTLKERKSRLAKLINAQILYLPTFRRIEQDLRSILPDLDAELSDYRRKQKLRFRHRPENNSYLELVEFGMQDVENKVNQKLKSIRDELNDKLKNDLTGRYLRDVINKKYHEVEYETLQAFSESAFNEIISRIDDTVLSKPEKRKLKSFVRNINQQGSIDKEENKIIAYFIYRLSEIYNDQKRKEEDVVQFVNICNEYSKNKIFIFDNLNFEIKIHPVIMGKINASNNIKFKDLSSGEKQIVSLFSHIYLSEQKNFFVIIDEPELSLSVPWQRRFLIDITNNKICKGLLAVTHSPFIFENDMERYAHGLEEFA